MTAPRALPATPVAPAARTPLTWLVENGLAALPDALQGPLSQALGTVAYLLAARQRAAVRANLAIVAADRPDRRALERCVFVSQVRHYLGIFRLLRLDPRELLDTVEIAGWEHFAEAYAQGKGVVVGSAHLGPVSVCGQIFVAKGIPITMPVEREGGTLARTVNRARSVHGTRFVSTESALGIYRVLRQGGLLGILADRAVTGVGERVPFFGREALLPSAHVVLALRTGAPLLPGFARRDGKRLLATFEPALELEPTGDHERDVRAGVRRFAEVMERHIRLAPEQWSVFDRVWP
ncbi:MAG: lysophospholipid acyltransferase family protein [Candidatus Limnocylindria bacterium]